MHESKNFRINDREYDALTGMPVNRTVMKQRLIDSMQITSNSDRRSLDINGGHVFPQQSATGNSAVAIHKQPERSRTLLRTATLRKPVGQSTIIAEAPPVEQGSGSSDIHIPHPIVERAIHRLEQQQPNPALIANQNSKELKEALIKERLAEVASIEEPEAKIPLGLQPRLTAILASSLAILIIAGYFTFLNLPNLSLRVAAAEAGISASFPGYIPNGYTFFGPITYSPGAVAIDFRSQSTNNSYMLKQEKSPWDSKAVLDNYVTKQTDSYVTYQDNGLTIYAFGNNAVWVNGGVLYTLEGSAHLTSDQILKIATSM